MSLVPIKEFKESEFKCQCGHIGCDYGYDDMDEEFLSRLFTARKLSYVGYTLTSAVRCPLHKLAVERPTSSHNANRVFRRKSCAVDIAVPNSSVAFEVMDSLRKAGFTRIGWNQKKNFVHVDGDKKKVQRVLFAY